jgi:hypothetical protein
MQKSCGHSAKVLIFVRNGSIGDGSLQAHQASDSGGRVIGINAKVLRVHDIAKTGVRDRPSRGQCKGPRSQVEMGHNPLNVHEPFPFVSRGLVRQVGWSGAGWETGGTEC